NRYAYSANDPVNKLDPGGNETEPDGTDYGVDTDGDGVPDAYDVSGMGVGGRTEAQKGAKVIEGPFASGAQYGGMSTDVASRFQAEAYAASEKTMREMYEAWQEGGSSLIDAASLVVAPLGGVSMGRTAVRWAKPSAEAVVQTPKVVSKWAKDTASAATSAAKNAAAAANNALKPWIRVKSSYSKALGQRTFSITWGSNTHYRNKQIGSAFLREVNRILRNTRLPGSSWRTIDRGHLHLWKKK
ncbi:MAG: hypothetical protein ACWA47_04705, partial [Brevirhabdus sp.]